MKTLFVGIALALVAAPAAIAGQAEEDQLYHWGECAVVGSMYESAEEQGLANSTVKAANVAFAELEPRMETYVNGLSDELGEDAADAVFSKLIDDYSGPMTDWTTASDRTAYPVRVWGKTMERCLSEARSLPPVETGK
ncbi:MAG: hypothetical protein GC145_08505 [Caulobacter sp.]|nr:hypothetical protein [Caulobacter sp.]